MGGGRARRQASLVEDVDRHADEAEGVLEEITGGVAKLIAGNVALVVPRLEIVAANAVPDDGYLIGEVLS